MTTPMPCLAGIYYGNSTNGLPFTRPDAGEQPGGSG